VVLPQFVQLPLPETTTDPAVGAAGIADAPAGD
jgi:hypothetical protein